MNKWKDTDFAYKGTITKPAHFCKECEMFCLCHVCMHEFSSIIKLIKPPRYPNLRKIIEKTKFKDLLEKT